MQQQLREYAFPLLLAAAFIVVGSLPYIYGYATAPPDQRFMDVVGRGTTGAQGYFMFARQVQDGGHLMQNLYTPSPTPQTYFNLEWWLFGKSAAWTGLSLPAMFHIWRVATVVGYMCAVYFLVSLCLASVGARRYVLLLITLGSGLGWIVWCVNRAGGLGLPIPLDLLGVCTPGYLVNKPHFIRACMFAALTYGFMLTGERTDRRRWFVLSGVCALAHAVIRPFPIPETYLIYAAFPLLLNLRGGYWSWRRIGNYAIAGAIVLPAAVYYAYMAHENTLGMEGWRQPSRFLLEIVLWLGWPFAVTCAYFVLRGFRPAAIRAASPPAIFLGLWLFTAYLLANAYPYYPVGHESAFYAFTIVPPLAVILGAWPALRDAVSHWRPALAQRLFTPGRIRLLAAVLLLAAMPSTVYVYANFFRDLHRERPEVSWRYYVHEDVIAAIHEVEQHAGARVQAGRPLVLTGPGIGAVIPRFADVRVVTGHAMLTPNFGKKNQLVHRFFHVPADHGWKRWLVGRYGVDYVLAGDEERRAGGLNAEAIPWLMPIFDRPHATLYAVR
ncbi:MAG: hypothetical protein ACLFTT_17620 [Candidatus Hydrogenedentota bacterium]